MICYDSRFYCCGNGCGVDDYLCCLFRLNAMKETLYIIDGFEIWANNESAAIEKYRLWCLPCWD